MGERKNKTKQKTNKKHKKNQSSRWKITTNLFDLALDTCAQPLFDVKNPE